MVTMTFAFSVEGAAPGEDTPRPMICSRASIRRWWEGRGSGSTVAPVSSVRGQGALRGSIALLMIAAPSGSRVPVRATIPAAFG